MAPTYGLRGESAGQNGIGVMAYSSHGSCTTKAIVGKVESSNGVAGEFTNYGNGNLTAGYTSTGRVFRIDSAGVFWGGAGYAESRKQSSGRHFNRSIREQERSRF